MTGRQDGRLKAIKTVRSPLQESRHQPSKKWDSEGLKQHRGDCLERGLGRDQLSERERMEGCVKDWGQQNNALPSTSTPSSLEPRNIMFHDKRFNTTVLAHLLLGASPLPGLQMVAFSLRPHTMQGERDPSRVWSSFYKAFILPIRASPL